MSATTKSPSLSPLTIRSTRSLSPRRRGSMAAPDPFGTFPDTARTMTSTLHIIKAPSHSVAQNAEERAKRQTRPHARSHSSGSTGQRISFAFSGFSTASPQRENSPGPRSATSEPARSASPLNTRPLFPRSNSFTNLSTTPHTPLTPFQVYDFAQQCNHPHSLPSTPVGNTPMPSSPVNFAPLPEAFQLPFLDRPSEVKDLLSQPLTFKLFLLLAQTFPSKTSWSSDADPVSWTYAQLEQWLTQTTRDEVGDIEWVHKAKLCISARSELIWERIKAALGVPPELDSLNKSLDKQNGTDLPVAEGCLNDEDISHSFGDAWVEPIVTSPTGSLPVPPSRSPTVSFPRSPTMNHQSVGRMEGISEDVPESASPPPPVPAVHGLRVVVSPSEPPARRYTSHSASYAGLSEPHLPYDAVAERGPGHPLFPTSFANLALGPTLPANNPSLRSPSVPPASAFSLSQSMLHPHRQVPSWAEGWDPQRQEFALSVASERSRRSVLVE